MLQEYDMLDAAESLVLRGDFIKAARICEQRMDEEPGNSRALYLSAVIARKQDRLTCSEDLLRRALHQETHDPRIWFELGTVLLRTERLDDAIDAFERAVGLAPQWDAPLVNLGALCEQLGRFDEAEAWCQRAIQLNPESILAHYNRGHIARSQGLLAQSIACYRKVLAIEPGHFMAHWNLGLSYLLSGNFSSGWPEYEWRERAQEVHTDAYPQPRWDGSSLRGNTLLVHAEQGIGDEILFASCYGELISQSGQCVFVCDPRLKQLFERSFPSAVCIGHQHRKDRAGARLDMPIDFQLPAGSLPLFLRSSAASFPQRQSFLLADSRKVADWRRRYDALGSGHKIGISWRAGGKLSEHRKRTTSLAEWQELLATPGVTWIDLQYGDTSDEVEREWRETGVRIHRFTEADPLIDMDSFAARVAALDLVISAGNATVHLAGALGVPAWALLPRVPSWRWLLEGDRSPWYSSVELFRQDDRRLWEPVFQRVTQRLRGQLGISPDGGALKTIRPSVAAPHSVVQKSLTSGRIIRGMDDIPAALDEGLAYHRAGRLKDAEEVYRAILTHSPRYSRALHLLGVLACNTGRVQLALESLHRALAVEPCAAYFHSLAEAQRAAGNFDEAIPTCRQALALKPNFAEAHLSLGALLEQLGERCEAEERYRTALHHDPNYAEAYVALAKLCHRQSRFPEAIAASQSALRIKPGFAPALNALGAALLSAERRDEAAAAFRSVLELDPDSVAAWNNLGRALELDQRTPEAVECYQRALKLRRSVETLNNLGKLARQQGQWGASQEYLEEAVRLRSGCPELHNELAVTLQAQGDHQAALAEYEQAISLNPRYAQAHFNRGLLLLELGRSAEGWREYDWRLELDDARGCRFPLEIPLWDGSSLADKTILVECEQGLGDELMFATCLPAIISQARHCLVTCDRRLERLFSKSFSSATVLPVVRTRECDWRLPANRHIDVKVSAGSLPGLLGRDSTSHPPRGPTLTVDEARLRRWRQRLGQLGPGLKVGIAWRGGQTALDRRLRWTPLEAWRPVLTQPGAHFTCLQYGDCLADIEMLRSQMQVVLHQWSDFDPMNDLDELAAHIRTLDLVISVGNANVHLAGCLGVPAWVVLPKHGAWRWPGHGNNPWYESVQVFRQETMGDWVPVLAGIANRLRERIVMHQGGL